MDERLKKIISKYTNSLNATTDRGEISIPNTLRLLELIFGVPYSSKEKRSKENGVLVYHCQNYLGHSHNPKANDGFDAHPSLKYNIEKKIAGCFVCGLIMTNPLDTILNFLWESYTKWNLVKQDLKSGKKIVWTDSYLTKDKVYKKYGITKTVFDFMEDLNREFGGVLEKEFGEILKEYKKTLDMKMVLKEMKKSDVLNKLSQEIFQGLYGRPWDKKLAYQSKYSEIREKADSLFFFLYSNNEANKEKYKELLRSFKETKKKEEEIIRNVKTEFLTEFLDWYWNLWDVTEEKIKKIQEKYKIPEEALKDKRSFYKYLQKNKQSGVSWEVVHSIMKIQPSKELEEYFLKQRGLPSLDVIQKNQIIDLQEKFVEDIKRKSFEITKNIIKKNKLQNNLYYYPSLVEFKNILQRYFNLEHIEEENLKRIYKEFLKNRGEKVLKIQQKTIYPIDILSYYFLENYIKFIRYGQLTVKWHRIMIPFFVLRGNGELAVGGIEFRALPDENGMAKNLELKSEEKKVTKKRRFKNIGSKEIFGIQQLLDDKCKLIFILEGQTDALTLQSLGFCAISIPGAAVSLNKDVLKLFNDKRVIILGDNDEPGKNFIKRISETLKKHSPYLNEKGEIPHYFIPPEEGVKDANDFIKKHGPEATKKFIEKIIKDSYGTLNFNTASIPPFEFDKEKKILQPRENVIPPGVNTTHSTNEENGKFYLGSFDKITETIEELGAKSVSIVEDGFFDYNKYVQWAKEKGKEIVLTLRFHFLEETGIIVFSSVEEMKNFIKETPKLRPSITILSKYSQNNVIILPVRYNKIYSKLDFSGANFENIYTGIDLNVIMTENGKYLPENFVFRPVLVNNNKYPREEYKDAYRILSAIKEKRKIYKKGLGSNKNNREYDYIYSTNKLIRKLPSEYPKEYIIAEALKNTFEVYKKVPANLEYKTKLSLHYESLLTDELKEEFDKKTDKKEKNKILFNQFRNILAYLFIPSLRKALEKNIPDWVKNIKKINLNLDEIKKENINLYEVYIERLKYEIETFRLANESEKYEENILLSYLMEVKWATENHFTAPGRGSAVGSLIVYGLGLTDFDPIKYNLSFDRFLNRARIKSKLPDIDIDVPPKEKIDIENEFHKKYPNTTGYGVVPVFISLKEYFNKFTKYIGVTYNQDTIQEISRINSLLDKENGLDKWKKEVKKFLAQKGLEENYIEIFLKTASQIEGEVINYNKHVSAFYSGKNLSAIPIQGEENGIPVYKATHEFLENNGFGIKHDFLSSNVTEGLSYVIKNYKIKGKIFYSSSDIIKLCEEYYANNEKIFRQLMSVGFEGIPQLDAKGYMKFLKETVYHRLDVKNIGDLSNFIALIRPGANVFEKDYIIYSELMRNSSIKNLKLKDINNLLNLIKSKEYRYLEKSLETPINENPKLQELKEKYIDYDSENLTAYDLLEEVRERTLETFENYVYGLIKNKPFYNLPLKNFETLKQIKDNILKYLPNVKLKTVYDLITFFRLLIYKKDLNKREFLKKNYKQYKEYFSTVITEQDIKNAQKGIVPQELREILKKIRNLAKEKNPDEKTTILLQLLEIENPNKLSDVNLLKKLHNLQDNLATALYMENEIYKEITKETNGTLLYQEQLMKLIKKGLEKEKKDSFEILSEVEDIRTAVAKKKQDLLNAKRETAINALKNIGLKDFVAQFLWEKIKSSAKYSFNKSHSLAYAFVSLFYIALKLEYSVIFALVARNILGKEVNLPNNVKNHPIANVSEIDSYILHKGYLVPPITSIEILKKRKIIAQRLKSLEPYKTFGEFLQKMKENRVFISNDLIIELIKNKFFEECVDEELLNYINKFKKHFSPDIISFYKNKLNAKPINKTKIKSEGGFKPF